MTAALLALALAATLPTGTARWRAELAGHPVGVAELSIACRGTACEVRYRARLRLPAESGGMVTDSGVELEVDRFGRYQGGRVRVRRAGAEREGAGVLGAVPASLVEVVLAAEATPDGAPTCVPWFEEAPQLRFPKERGSAGGEGPEGRRACARRSGAAVVVDLGAGPVSIVPAPDRFPAEVVVAGRFRYVRDAAAEVPREAPRLAGARVRGPADPRRARAFCDVPVDGAPVAPPDADVAELPPPAARGESCREKSNAWLAAARRRGFEGRTAVGVAWDGQGFVWHAWAEVQVGGVWLPVDPAFGQLPARGPRFTVGRYAEADAAARDAAGARILGCWGVGGVE